MIISSHATLAHSADLWEIGKHWQRNYRRNELYQNWTMTRPNPQALKILFDLSSWWVTIQSRATQWAYKVPLWCHCLSRYLFWSEPDLRRWRWWDNANYNLPCPLRKPQWHWWQCNRQHGIDSRVKHCHFLSASLWNKIEQQQHTNVGSSVGELVPKTTMLVERWLFLQSHKWLHHHPSIIGSVGIFPSSAIKQHLSWRLNVSANL